MTEPTEQDLIDARALRNGELGKLMTAFIHAGSIQEGNDAIQEIEMLIARLIAGTRARAIAARVGAMSIDNSAWQFGLVQPTVSQYKLPPPPQMLMKTEDYVNFVLTDALTKFQAQITKALEQVPRR